MSFYLSWAIVWWFRFLFICSVGHNDSEQMVTQPMIEQKTVQETGKERKRLRCATQNEFQRRSRRKKNQQTSSFLSVICGLSFHYVIWIALPHAWHILCMQHTHTAHHYCHDIQHGHTFYFLFFLAAFVWSALRHYRMQCYCLHCQRIKRQETYLHIKKHLVRQRISLKKKCLHWVFNVFTSNKFNERIVCCEKSSLCFIDIFDWIVAFACALKWLLEIIIWFNVHICLEITLILNLIPHKSIK